MALEILRIILGILLIFVLPGTMLIKAMFPRPGELDEEYNGIYVLALGMATSICLTILVGFVLGSLPVKDDGTGWFDAPLITGSLVALTIIFFAIGWWRGAYPWLGLAHPKLARFPLPAEAPRGTKRDDELAARVEELTKKHDRLKREVKDLLRRERTHGRKMAKHYKERREEAEGELAEVRDELDDAKERQSKLIYEAKQREEAKRRRRQRRKEEREKDKDKASEKTPEKPPAKTPGPEEEEGDEGSEGEEGEEQVDEKEG